MKKFILFFSILFLAIFLSGCEREGVVTYDDCREVVSLKADNLQKYFKQFTCEYVKSPDDKILGGICVNVKNDSSMFSSSHTCKTAYVYTRDSDIGCPDTKNGYLNMIDGKCYCNKNYQYNTFSNVCEPIPFPFDNIDMQYGWYDNHDIPMSDRCYTSGGCSVENWAYAIYRDKNDSRGATLKQQCDAAKLTTNTPSFAEKCVTESGMKICDLSYNVKSTNKDGIREVGFLANQIKCVNVASGKRMQGQGDTIQIDGGNTYCVSDFGTVYIDPTILVSKHFNEITRYGYGAPFYVPIVYRTCIWTYVDGSGAIPNIEILSDVGPSSGWDVKAFCRNGDNEVDIYSYIGD